MSGYNAGYNSEWLIYSWQYIICLFMWSHPFFSESCFLATNIWKKIREKIRSEKNEVSGCVGWEGEVDQWNRIQCLTFLECITALFWWAELKQFCPLPKVIPTVVVVVVVWFGLFVFFFFFAKLIAKLPFVLSFKCFYVYYLLWTMLRRVAFFMFLRTSIGLHNISLPLL